MYVYCMSYTLDNGILIACNFFVLSGHVGTVFV